MSKYDTGLPRSPRGLNSWISGNDDEGGDRAEQALRRVRRKALELIEAGKPVAAIAAQRWITAQTVYSWRNRTELEATPPRERADEGADQTKGR